MDSPRIHFLITSLGVGGAERQLLKIAKYLKHHEWHVSVSALHPPADLADEFEHEGLRVQFLSKTNTKVNLQSAINLHRILKSQKPDALVTFLLQANLVGRTFGTLSHVPVISSIRNTQFGGKSAIGRWTGNLLERFSSPLAKAVVFNSHLAADMAIKRYLVPAAKAHVIPNAVSGISDASSRKDLLELRQSIVGRESSMNQFLWLSVGRLEPQKNYPALLRAFKRIVTENNQSHLLIAGEGREQSSLRQLVHDLRLQSNVSLLGVRRDIPQLLQAVDALILASKWEGLPNVVLEAFAAGTPVVGTPVGGIPELIQHGRNGWLAASPTEADLFFSMSDFMRQPVRKRETIAINGKATLTDRYSIAVVGYQWKTLLEAVLVPNR